MTSQNCLKTGLLRVASIATSRTARVSQALPQSHTRGATTLPVTAYGPPPKASVPLPSAHSERLARRRQRNEALQRRPTGRDRQSLVGTAKRRFWREVRVAEIPDAEGFQILLDNRPVRTPDKRILKIPADKPQLAMAIALEWDLLLTSKQALKHHYIPLTSLAARAESILEMEQAGQTTTRKEVADLMLKYLDTDTALCLAPESRDFPGSASGGGKSLRELQVESTQSLVAFLTSNVWFGASIRPVSEDDGLVPASQPQTTKDIVRGWINALPPYELVGLERAALAAKSLLIAARLVVEWSPTLAPPNHDRPQHYHRRFGAEEAAEAASLEVRFQTQQWGEVEDTHDVDKEDLTRQLASVVVLISGI